MKNLSKRLAIGGVILLIAQSLLGKSLCLSSVLSYTIPRWEIPPEKWEVRLLKTYPLYLVEGKGGLGVVLSENEDQLRKALGVPAFRDYGRPERLFYSRNKFRADFILKRGRIIEIRYHIVEGIMESYPWFTALGLRQEDIESLTLEEATEKLIQYYAGARYIKLKEELVFFNRGIGFIFKNNKLREIRIFHPYQLR